MAVAFTPKGAVAEWRLVYDFLVPLDVGALVTYEALDEVLGRDFRPARSPFHRANRQLLADRKRGLVNVKNVGYRIVPAAEHEEAARHHHQRARRSLGRSYDWLRYANRRELSSEAAARLDLLELQVSRERSFTRQLDGRVSSLEKALEASRREAAEAVVGSEERMSARLLEILARHGITET